MNSASSTCHAARPALRQAARFIAALAAAGMLATSLPGNAAAHPALASRRADTVHIGGTDRLTGLPARILADQLDQPLNNNLRFTYTAAAPIDDAVATLALSKQDWPSQLTLAADRPDWQIGDPET